MQGLPLWQRLLAVAAYLLPWRDGLDFSAGFLGAFPELRPVVNALALPVFPLVAVENLLPFGSLVVFLGLYLGVVRNLRVPYAIRFNVLQAILLDIVLVLARLLLSLVANVQAASFALRTLNDTVFLGTVLVIGFCVVQGLRGQEPDLPTVSEAVRMQL
ncbi:MAG: Tic20 family protein [Cyanobacteriota bacterium]